MTDRAVKDRCCKKNKPLVESLVCMSVPSDQHLEHALEKLFSTYADAIFRFHCLHVYDRDLAKDLTQETFIRYWQCLVRGESIEHARAFLYRIANNLMIDYCRKKKTISLDALLEQGFEPSGNQSPLRDTHNHLELARVMRMMQKLQSWGL